MSIGERIEARLHALGITQSELARRTKLPQTTINSLIRANRRSSPHIVRLARELATTPAYLASETDDPEADAPPLPEFSYDERELLECFRAMAPADRLASLQLFRTIADRSKRSEAVHSQRLAFRAEADDPPRYLAAA